jgi:hypothetical protein
VVKYAILIYDVPETLEQMVDSGMLQEYDAFANGLVERGQMRGGEQLAMHSVTTLRSENGKTVVSDGPFAETKEQLGGFFLIECDSLDQALESAGRVPSLRYGGAVEVRPIVEQNMEHH